MNTDQIINKIHAGALLFFILLLTLSSPCTAASYRPYVGFLPFESTLHSRHIPATAIPCIISWQLYFIPGIDQVEMLRNISCFDIDLLKRPKDPSDTAAYSQLTQSLGLDYLITGSIDDISQSRVRFRVYIYSAPGVSLPHRSTFSASCDISDLNHTAAGIAWGIAESIGVPVDPAIVFDKEKIDPRALPEFESAMQLLFSTERDISDHYRALRIFNNNSVIRNTSHLARTLIAVYGFRFGNRMGRMSEAISRTPGNLFIIRQITLDYLDFDEIDRARPYLSMWLKIDPTSPQARIASGEKSVASPSHAWRSDLAIAEAYAIHRDIAVALRRFSAIEKQHPNSAYVHLAIGQAIARRDRWPEAVEQFEKALRINPDSYRIHLRLVDAYRRAGEEDKAEKALYEVLKKWPNRTEAHYIAARMYMAKGNLGMAVKENRIIAKLDPRSEIDHRLIAHDYMHNGKMVEAIRELAKADPTIRTTMIITCLVLTGVFLIAIIAAALIIRVMLAPDGKGHKSKAVG